MITLTLHNVQLPGHSSEPIDLKVTVERGDNDKIRFQLDSEPGHWREVPRYGKSAEDWKMMDQFLHAIGRLILTRFGMP